MDGPESQNTQQIVDGLSIQQPSKPKGRKLFWASGITVGLLVALAAAHFFSAINVLVLGLSKSKTNSVIEVNVPRSTPTPSPTLNTSTALSNAWATTIVGRQGSVDIAVYNNTTGEITHYTNTGGTFYTASIVKVSILEALLVEDQDAGQTLTSGQLAEATPMIENSNDDAATDLWDYVGGAPAMNNLFSQLGATSTTAGLDDYWGLTQTTALDQIKVLNALAYPGGLLSDASAEAADGLLDNIEADQLWGVSGGVPSGVSIELKDGWLSYTNGWIINSIGHVHGDGVDYTIAVLTTGNPSEQYGIDTIQSLSSETWSLVASAQ